MAEEIIQPDVQSTATVSPEIAAHPIVARADRSYRLKRFILAAVIFVYGLMSVRDGFFRYPRDNAADEAKGYSNVRHPGLDIPFNQTLGIILPPAALAFLAWSLYASRGEFRLDGTTLHAPGRPPIPLSTMRSIDRSRWDRKGIATVTYQLPEMSEPAKFKLDDFVYRRPPMDQIFAHLEAAFAEPIAEDNASSPAGVEDAL